jgi:bifunctional non-homologous end joining protein LigD
MKDAEVAIGGLRLKLTNLDKVLYPKAGFTKAQVIDYYRRIAPAVLPHLRDRPLTLKRYPNGVEGEYFYEKNCPRHRPSWVKTAEVWSDQNQRVILFCLAQDLPTLIWAANLADLELHTPLHRAPEVDRPDAVVFDLDPGAPADLVQCCEVALLLEGLFQHLRLKSFAKTSGSKGLQVYVPLNTPATYEETKAFARSVAETLEAKQPALIVSNMKKALRVGKVLVDWSQNDAHKTTVCVYSLRAKERPTVSTPVTWDEVKRCAKRRDPALLSFESEQAIARFEKSGDLFVPLLELEQTLPRLR